MRVLIVGAGIAGPTLAHWLRRSGHTPTLVESSPRPRAGGYLLDFWGAGFDVAERMGIVPRLKEEGYRARELREVSAKGRRIAHVDPRTLIKGAVGKYVTIARSDLARAIYDSLDGDVETIFDDTVEELTDDGHRVHAEFTRASARDFDLVVGADGLHSRVRSLTFGPERDFARDTGITVVAFEVDGYTPRDELVGVTHTRVGASTLRFAQRDGSTVICFMFRHPGEIPDDLSAQHELLKTSLGDTGGEVPRMLAAMRDARTFYIDRATQIRMRSWSRGRVALVGDAAASPSLLAGQGSALAMVESYVLAAQLSRAAGDHRSALAAYEQHLAAMVRAKQDAALRLVPGVAPRNRLDVLARVATINLMRMPVLPRLVAGRILRDPIELPSFAG